MRADRGRLYWAEDRPLEGGRCALRVLGDDGPEDVTPGGLDVRTRVHEYGGAAWTVHEGTLFLVDRPDQRLCRLTPGGTAEPLTAEPAVAAGLRYADVVVTPDGGWLVCVRESHEAGEVRNELVAVPARGDGPVRTLASGRDFYAFPRLSPAGVRLAWIEWDHPRMPWDGTELRVAGFRDGALTTAPEPVAGGPEESIFQPGWDPAGRLHFVSDRTGWWNLYRQDRTGPTALAPVEAELGAPAWVFGLSTYAFLPGGRIACLSTRDQRQQLGIIEPGGGRIAHLDLPYTFYTPRLCAVGERVAVIAATPAEGPAVVLVDPSSGETSTVCRSGDGLDAAHCSVPRPVAFPTTGGETANALYYPPANPAFRGPDGERPPLLVTAHGGPTSQVVHALDFRVQYFTSRGFAVCEVDYRGSTGYGRAYRERLRGGWGVVDVDDCIAAAGHLAALGLADPRRTVIRGASAGGYTALCALTFHDAFTVGASHYGLVDLELVARETHKFESRYIDSLVGPYPEATATYRERSPLRHCDRLARPVILFQGALDPVVPASQTRALTRALDVRRVPFAYVEIEDESHGFARAESIVRVLEAELSFYGRVFGFEPAGPLDGVTVRHL